MPGGGGTRTPCEGFHSLILRTANIGLRNRLPQGWQINIPLDAKVLTRLAAAEAACVTHQDEGVGFPVGRGDLIRQPGGDGFGRLDAELRHGLGHQVHPVQETLRRVAVVLQETVRLEEQKEFG